MFIGVSVYVYMCLLVFSSSLCVCVIVGGAYVSVTICLRMHLCVSSCVHVPYWEHPWADSQKERLTGPCGHASHLVGSMVPS